MSAFLSHMGRDYTSKPATGLTSVCVVLGYKSRHHPQTSQKLDSLVSIGYSRLSWKPVDVTKSICGLDLFHDEVTVMTSQ